MSIYYELEAQIRELKGRLHSANAAIVGTEKEKELYRMRWLSGITQEEAARLKEQLSDADAVIAHSMFDEGRASKDLLRWADEALERHRAREQERPDDNQFGVGA